jgi:hypothetical protein
MWFKLIELIIKKRLHICKIIPFYLLMSKKKRILIRVVREYFSKCVSGMQI